MSLVVPNKAFRPGKVGWLDSRVVRVSIRKVLRRFASSAYLLTKSPGERKALHPFTADLFTPYASIFSASHGRPRCAVISSKHA